MHETAPQQPASDASHATTPDAARALAASDNYLAAFPEALAPADQAHLARRRPMRAVPRVWGATLK
jgi:hypothetical protein